MKRSTDNVCANCSTGQECCTTLLGLRLTESEWERHFAQHREMLVVQHDHSFYSVSARKGKPCPNWRGSQCTIYHDRPIECRLFPYTIGWFYHKRGRVKMTFHSWTRCPKKKKLLIAEDQAREMVYLFARTGFGDEYTVEVERGGPFMAYKEKVKKLRDKIIQGYRE